LIYRKPASLDSFQCAPSVSLELLQNTAFAFASHAALLYRRLHASPGAVDLTFASVSLRILKANVKSKTTLETYIYWCLFGSDIRERTSRDTIRMPEPGPGGLPL
jgi:hypothetical protein